MVNQPEVSDKTYVRQTVWMERNSPWIVALLFLGTVWSNMVLQAPAWVILLALSGGIGSYLNWKSLCETNDHSQLAMLVGILAPTFAFSISSKEQYLLPFLAILSLHQLAFFTLILFPRIRKRLVSRIRPPDQYH